LLYRFYQFSARGGSIVLSACGATCGSTSKYQWSNASGNISGATSSSITVTTAGTYYVTVTNGTTSATSLGTVVNVYALPAAYYRWQPNHMCQYQHYPWWYCSGQAAHTNGVQVTITQTTMMMQMTMTIAQAFVAYTSSIVVSPSFTTTYTLTENQC